MLYFGRLPGGWLAIFGKPVFKTTRHNSLMVERSSYERRGFEASINIPSYIFFYLKGETTMTNTEFVVTVAMGRLKYVSPEFVVNKKTRIPLDTIDKDYTGFSLTNWCNGARSDGKPDFKKLYWGLEYNGQRIGVICGDIEPGILVELLASIVDAHYDNIPFMFRTKKD